MLRDDKFQHTLKRAQVSANKQQKFTNDAYLPRPALLARVKGLRIEMRLKKKNNIFLQTSYNELKRAKTRLSSILSECTARKDTKAIIYNLRCAYEKGYLSDKDNVLSLIQNVTANLQKKNHGKRYEKISKNFYEALMLIGGPRVTRCVADNMNGPGELSFYPS